MAGSEADPGATIVAEIRQSAREFIRVVRGSNRGRPTVSVRIWFKASDGSIRPGRAGLTMSPNALSQVVAALQAARLKITDEGAL